MTALSLATLAQKRFLLAFLLPLFSTTMHRAANYVWDGGAGTNNWTHANNWNPNFVPGASDQAIISSASVIIPPGTNAAIQKLTLSANGALTIQENASLALSGGTYDRRIQIEGIGAHLTNNGILTAIQSTLMGMYIKNGSFTNNGTASITYSGSHGGIEMRDNSTFTNFGIITIEYVTDGDAIHQIESTAVVYNHGYMRFQHLHDGIFGYAGTHFHNYGTVDIFYHDIENIAEVLIDGEGGLDFHNYAGAVVRGDGLIGPDVFIHAGGTVDPTDDTGEGIGAVNFYCNTAPCVDQNFANSNLVIDIEGTAGGGVMNGHDKFSFSHTANFASTTVFNVILSGSYAPQAGHSFVIMTYPSKTGMPSFELPALPGGLSWNTSVTNTQIQLFISGALPVTWLDFIARQQENTVVLEWETGSEKDNRGFFVERRAREEENWTELSFISGNGTTSLASIYAFLDKRPLSGMNYYRLRQTDFDGQETWSPVVAVNFERDDISYWLLPNPASDELYFTLPQGNSQLEIYDANGRQVLKREMNSNQTNLDISHLINGIYMARLHTENGWKSTRFVKN